MSGSGSRLGNKGQMMVEMAVCIPVLLAVLGVAVNMMVFLGDCARFDRIAADAVRSQAASPGYDSYGSTARAQAVQAVISSQFAGQGNLSFSVSAEAVGLTSQSDEADADKGFSFSLTPHLEQYTCSMAYRPWGFGDSFFGVSFSGIPHSRTYVIDPYKPGVLF